MFATVDRLVEAGHDPRRFAADLLQRLRDLTLLQAVPDAGEQGLVDAAGDELARMVEEAAKLGPATLVRYGEILHAGLVEMRGATAPRLLLELLCARMLLPAASTSEPSLLERLERMERRAAIAPDTVPIGTTAAAPPPPPDATESDAARRTFLRTSSDEEPAAAPPRTEEPVEAPARVEADPALSRSPRHRSPPPRLRRSTQPQSGASGPRSCPRPSSAAAAPER